jgi:hypothetical protein
MIIASHGYYPPWIFTLQASGDFAFSESFSSFGWVPLDLEIPSFGFLLFG